MIKSALLAFGDLLSPLFRKVLFKAVGLTLVLFIAIILGVEWLINYVASFPWAWAEALAAVSAGIGLLVVFFFMMAPVTVLFAGLYLDDVAELVERNHYPLDPPGSPLPLRLAIVTSLQFVFIMLLVNLAVLPLVFTGIGAVALVLANAYLISREYFEMIAMRHMPVAEARMLRKANTPLIFVAGTLPAFMALVPVLNVLVPLFATALFVHIFKRVQVSSG